MLRIIAETIREASPVPSGVLYAGLMSKLDLQAYNKIIETLKRAGLVAESANILTWTGPKL